MKLNDIVKDIKGIRVSTDVKILLAGLVWLIGVDRGCSSHETVDTTGLEKEIKAAQTSLDSISARYGAAAAKRDMYDHKCDSLCPVVGVPEAPADRARKNREWRAYRDSLSKYRDQATLLKIDCDWARLRVDTLRSKLERIR